MTYIPLMNASADTSSPQLETFGQLALEEVDVGLEVVSGYHLEGEEVMVVSIGFLARDVLCKKCLG